MAKKSWERAKDPDETRDYGLNWASDIGTETITTSVWEVEDGTATVVTQSHDTTTSTVRLSGGSLGETCAVLNTVTLSNGEIAQQTVYLKIRER